MDNDRKIEEQFYEDEDLDFFFEFKEKVIHLASLVKNIPEPLRFTRNKFIIECKTVPIKPKEKSVDVRVDDILEKIQDGYKYIKEYDIADELEEIYGGIPSFDKMKEDKIPLPVRLFACSNHEISEEGIYSYSTMDGVEFFRVTGPENKEDALRVKATKKVSLDDKIEIIDDQVDPESGMPICFKFK